MAQSSSILGWLDRTGVPLLLARVVVGGTFVYMAIMKLSNPPREFQTAINLYNVLPLNPPELVNAVAIVVPWLELICGLALLAGVLIRGASAIIFGMLCVFTPALYMHAITLMNEGRFETFCDVSFDCGCGTGEEWMCVKIPVNLGLLLMAFIALRCQSRKFCLSSRLFRRGSGPKPPAKVVSVESVPD